jgi:hypothetical protein
MGRIIIIPLSSSFHIINEGKREVDGDGDDWILFVGRKNNSCSLSLSGNSWILLKYVIKGGGGGEWKE